MAVVVSEEQGEVDKFRKWELDITPHRRLMKDGIELPESMRSNLSTAICRRWHWMMPSRQRSIRCA